MNRGICFGYAVYYHYGQFGPKTKSFEEAKFFVIIFTYHLRLGAVHKLRLQEEGGRWSKKLTFCKLSYHRKCKRRGVGVQKKTNLVNVVCESPQRLNAEWHL